MALEQYPRAYIPIHSLQCGADGHRETEKEIDIQKEKDRETEQQTGPGPGMSFCFINFLF